MTASRHALPRRTFLRLGSRLAAVAALGPLLAACSPEAGGPGGASTTTSSAARTSLPIPASAFSPAAKEVVIGGVYPLTGPSAATGVDLTNGYKLAADLINGKFPNLNLPLAKDEGLPNLGHAKVRFVFADHQSSPEKGKSETERLITQEKVVAVVGAYISGVTGPASQAAEQAGIPFLDPDAVAPSLIKRGYRWFFRITADDEIFFRDTFFPRILPEIEKRKNFPVKTIALFREKTLTGDDMAKYVGEYAPKAGKQILGDISYQSKTTNLDAETEKLKALNPDLVLSLWYISEAILAITTWKKLDYMPPIHIDDGGHRAKQYLDAVGKDADGEMQMDQFSLGFAKNRKVITQVNAMFKQRFNTDLNTDSSRTMMGALVLADAINRAGSTKPEAIRDALLQTNIPPDQTLTSWGGVKFNPENGQNELATFCLQQCRDARWELAWPFEDAAIDMVVPQPKWDQRK